MTICSPFRYFKTSPEIIRLAVMMYTRFPLSLRNVEDLLHERGIEICHETVRFWRHRFGPMFAAEIRRRRVEGMRSSRWRWHVDEVFVKINGERHGPADELVTDCLRSYGAALGELGIRDRQRTGRWTNNRAENSHQPFRRRERAMLRFRRVRTLQKFAAVHASVYNHFNTERSLSSRQIFKANRAAALAEWRGLCAAQGIASLSKLRLVRICLPSTPRCIPA